MMDNSNSSDEVVQKKNFQCCSCKKLSTDTFQNICCFCINTHLYFDQFDTVPLTYYLCNTSNKACNGKYNQDDMRCFCWVFSPISYIFDCLSCPFRICHYIHKKRINGGGIPCYEHEETENITTQPQ